jgi:hypothetical protein
VHPSRDIGRSLPRCDRILPSIGMDPSRDRSRSLPRCDRIRPSIGMHVARGMVRFVSLGDLPPPTMRIRESCAVDRSRPRSDRKTCHARPKCHPCLVSGQRPATSRASGCRRQRAFFEEVRPSRSFPRRPDTHRRRRSVTHFDSGPACRRGDTAERGAPQTRRWIERRRVALRVPSYRRQDEGMPKSCRLLYQRVKEGDSQ